jgi:hypothetical protein
MVCQLRTHAPQKSAAIRSPRGHWRAKRRVVVEMEPIQRIRHHAVDVSDTDLRGFITSAETNGPPKRAGSIFP